MMERRTFIRVIAVGLLTLLAITVSGCASISGRVLRDSREQFNETAQITNAEQLLQNIVRLRYASSPYFLEISSISTSATMSGSVSLSGNTVSPGPGISPNVVIAPGASYSQTPSFVFQPLTGEKLARQLLRPVEMRTLALLRTAGWNLRDILLVLADSINGIPNAPAATQFAPEGVPENAEFRRVVSLLAQLEEQGLIQLGLDSGAAQDPRADIALSLQIDRAAVSRPDVKALIEKLSLDPSNLTYRLVAAVSGGGGKNIAVKPRSILAAMRYLSKGIDIPDGDLRSGLVPVLRESDDSAREWTKLMSGTMHISSGETWPMSAYVRVFYQGHWFHIDNADLASKQSFALIETAFALQAGDVPPITTILTLPISR